MIRRAARSVAVLTALAVTAVVALMSVAVVVVNEHQQHAEAERVSRSAWSTADDVGDPPTGTVLVVVTPSGRRLVSPGAPEAVNSIDPRTLADGASRVLHDGRELAVWTGDRRLGRVSAAYDLGPTEEAGRRLAASLVVAALVGVVGAAAIGLAIGRRAVRPLGAALALQRRFVADASHELRTPLTVLLTRAQLLRRHIDRVAAPDQVREVDQLVRDARVLGDVVSDLLLSAELAHRPQVGEPVDVVSLAEAVTTSLQPLAAESGVELTVTVPTGRALTAQGAAPALRRALTALVDNAIAHTASGGHVRIEVEAGGDAVVLSVRDDGEGFDPEANDQVRQRFSRGTVEGAGRRFGLGLALVDEVARAHGGVLDIASRPGAGATFTLRLPRSP
jgi:signal transduction histidine kinase